MQLAAGGTWDTPVHTPTLSFLFIHICIWSTSTPGFTLASPDLFAAVLITEHNCQWS